MGSLPNLHELEQIERRRERRRERELLREQRARDSSHEHERLARLAQHKKSSYNTYLMAGLGLGGGTSGISAVAAGAAHITNKATGATSGISNIVSGVAATSGDFSASTAIGGDGDDASSKVLSNFTVGGAALLGLGASGTAKTSTVADPGAGVSCLLGKQHQHQHHRHSLTSRHRVLRPRISGTAHNIWDEQMLEHLAAYSPVSTRSHRINPVSSYQVQAALAASRRRESINSSIGATSIRRLITLNNRNCRHKVPLHVRHKVCRNFTFLCIAHGLMCAILMPLFGLQGSNSLWHHREQWLHLGPNIGSLLLSVTFLVAAGMCLLIARLVRKFGYSLLVAACYVAMSIFLMCHLYPSIYTLLPGYLLLGVTLSPAWVSKISLVVHFGSKLSCSQHECTLSSSHALDPLDEHKIFCNRDTKVRRLARWFQASQDLGIILGALIASIVLSCSSDDWNCFALSDAVATQPQLTEIRTGTLRQNTTNVNSSTFETEDIPFPTAVAFQAFPDLWPHISSHADAFYIHNEHGERICGADLCPVWRQHEWNLQSVNSYTTATISSNETIFTLFTNDKARTGGFLLVGILFFLSIISILLSFFMDKIQATFRHDRYKGIADTLLFAGPMAYFIGTEQAYMLGDFLRAFVSCSLGISMVAGALVGMGLMQSIVSCTLSMLLRHTKRIVVILAGFFFHSCLLLALSRWKPSSDDSALFYVLAASWGACNGMWETLLLALVTLNHTNHVIDVAAPLQGLRFLGLGITFAAHGYMCETPKIIILVIILVLSVPPYAMLEIRLEAQRKAHMINL